VKIVRVILAVEIWNMTALQLFWQGLLVHVVLSPKFAAFSIRLRLRAMTALTRKPYMK